MKNLIAVGVLGITIVGGILGVSKFSAEDNSKIGAEQKIIVEYKREIEFTEPKEENVKTTLLTVEGSFTGWIDNQSFEVMMDSGAMAFRFFEANINDFKENDLIVVKYHENDDGQNVVESINKK
ncbi:hypothetical protein [Bacillus sp. JJ1562]|uniref:hypothetical protein n=1 Tax=Bacillus sp. JJ1562 TaxID=3122960 RepID=UPI003002232F